MKFRNILLGNYREEILSDIICKEIPNLENFKKKRVIKIIDYGSGHNPVVIEKIINKLSFKYKKNIFKAYCFDFYNRKQIQAMNRVKNIKFYHVNKLSNKKTTKFNFCLLIDVLHHIGVENNGKKIYEITKNLKKKSKFILIKDHFQYGFLTNLLLIIMDFFGNYTDGVKIPQIYFSKNTYRKFISKVNLSEIKRINNKSYYKWYWLFFNMKKLQFISILR